MATSKNGPQGLLSGKIGGNYYYVRYGKQFVRAAPHTAKAKTKKQLAVMQRLVLLSPIYKLLKLYIRVGFELSGKEKQKSASSCFRAVNLPEAIKGTYPDQEVHYALLRLSEGNLALPLNPIAAGTATGIKFTWAFDPLDETGAMYDRTMLMAYFPEKQLFFQIITGAARSQGEELLEIPTLLKGQYAETYISFITDDRSAISNSVYTGRVLY